VCDPQKHETDDGTYVDYKIEAEVGVCMASCVVVVVVVVVVFLLCCVVFCSVVLSYSSVVLLNSQILRRCCMESLLSLDTYLRSTLLNSCSLLFSLSCSLSLLRARSLSSPRARSLFSLFLFDSPPTTMCTLPSPISFLSLVFLTTCKHAYSLTHLCCHTHITCHPSLTHSRTCTPTEFLPTFPGQILCLSSAFQ
jgi:hypothetical protein